MMNNFRRNILSAVIALLLTIAMIALTFDFRREIGWWAFIDCFMLFMTVFVWMMSLLIGKMIPHSGMVLRKIAVICGILFVISLVAEYFAYSVI